MVDALQHGLDVELFRQALARVERDELALAKLRATSAGRLAWDRLQRAEKRRVARRRLRGRRWREAECSREGVTRG